MMRDLLFDLSPNADPLYVQLNRAGVNPYDTSLWTDDQMRERVAAMLNTLQVLLNDATWRKYDA